MVRESWLWCSECQEGIGKLIEENEKPRFEQPYVICKNCMADDRIEIMKVIDIFWALSHFLLLFSVLESSAKVIVSVAYPGEFKSGRGDLTQIYQKLLGKNFVDYKCLIDLFELTRNVSVHRGSVYFGP